jgi:VCBS repeat-containing protein
MAVAVLLLFAFLFPAPAAATTVQSPPWADIMSGPMWAGIDPRGDADTAVAYLKQMGYWTFDDNNNTTATQALSSGWAQSDAVWVAFGHAMAGQITIESGATGGPSSSTIGAVVANRNVGVSPDFSKGPKAYMYDMPYHQLSKMKLMAFIGCNTGNDGAKGSPWDGNLVKEAIGDQGVKSAIGFTHEIYFTPNAADLWTDSFFHGLKNGKSVTDSASDGYNNVFFWWLGFNDTWGFSGPFIQGGSTKLTPASYGS